MATIELRKSNSSKLVSLVFVPINAMSNRRIKLSRKRMMLVLHRDKKSPAKIILEKDVQVEYVLEALTS